MDESNEKSPLLRQDLGLSSTNTSTVSTTRMQCKVYKRRWYVLFVFTAEAFVYNLAWNTWGPIQEPSKFAYGWTDFNVLLITSWAAIGLLATSIPLTWLMDAKGLYFRALDSWHDRSRTYTCQVKAHWSRGFLFLLALCLLFNDSARHGTASILTVQYLLYNNLFYGFSFFEILFIGSKATRISQSLAQARTFFWLLFVIYRISKFEIQLTLIKIWFLLFYQFL